MTLTQEPSTGLVPAGIDPYQFLGLLQRQAATVTVVTSPAADGLPPAGFTATSFTSVSLRPQLVSFCLDTDSTSWPSIRRAPHVAIHLLRAGQRDLARTFAAKGVDRFADTSLWRPGAYGLPLLKGVLATLICEVVDRVPAGDHAIVLGQPVSSRHEDGDPLLYQMGGYQRLAEDGR